MKTIFQKNQIVESLNGLDHDQTEKVLNFIKGLTARIAQDEDPQQRIKREAMVQIRQALRNERKLQPGF